MSAVPSADERYSFEPEGFLVVESILDRDHVARLRAALQRSIARRRELERVVCAAWSARHAAVRATG